MLHLVGTWTSLTWPVTSSSSEPVLPQQHFCVLRILFSWVCSSCSCIQSTLRQWTRTQSPGETSPVVHGPELGLHQEPIGVEDDQLPVPHVHDQFRNSTRQFQIYINSHDTFHSWSLEDSFLLHQRYGQERTTQSLTSFGKIIKVPRGSKLFNHHKHYPQTRGFCPLREVSLADFGSSSITTRMYDQ